MHKLRLALTTLGIALGVAVFFAIETANAALVTSLNSTIEKLAGRSTLEVAAGDVGFAMDVIGKVRDTPGVAMAEPVTETLAATTLGGDTRVLILGLDTGSDLSLYANGDDQSGVVVKNPVAFQNRADSVAVTRVFAERNRLNDGDRFQVRTASGLVDLTVRGIFSATGIGEVYDGNVAVMDIYSAQQVFGRGKKIDRIDIATATDADVDEVRTRLMERLGPGINVTRPELRGKTLENTVSAMHAAFTITSILALTIGVFLIFNSFSISVSQRWKEIAVLRSLGVERRNVRLMFLAEALMQGVIGSALGVAGGYWLAKAAMVIVTGVSARIYGLTLSAGGVGFDLRFATEALVLGLAASILAAWVPASSASKIEPALALRNIETRQPSGRTSFLRPFAGIALVAAGLLLTAFSPPAIGSFIQTGYSFAMQIGMVMLLPKIMELGAFILRPVMQKLFGIEGVIAVDSMSHAPKRTVATVGAIMIGLSFALATASLIASQKRAIHNSLDKAVAADILVTTSDQLSSRTDHFNQATTARITDLPEIRRADPIRVTTVDYDGGQLMLLAHDMQAYFDISPDLLDRGDPTAARDAAAAGKGLIVSTNMGFRWGLKIGDILRLPSPRGEVALPIVGMVDYYRSERGTILMDRQTYYQYWDDTDSDYIYIDLNPDVDKQIFKQKIQAVIAGTQQAFIYTHDEYKAWGTKIIDQFFTLMYMQMVVAIIVAGIGLINTMLISVAERRREIGIFRAVGGLRLQVVKMVVLEAAAISVMGFISGAVLGALNSYFLVKTAVKAVAGFDLPLTFPTGMALLAIPVIILIAAAAAWLPAWKAARLSVTEAIGYE